MCLCVLLSPSIFIQHMYPPPLPPLAPPPPPLSYKVAEALRRAKLQVPWSSRTL